jgi:hypothetical protein
MVYHPIQSPYLFGDNLIFFGVLFYVWFCLLLLLVFTGKAEAKTDWEKLSLVVIASLVFLVFWVIILPYGRLDYFGFAGLSNIITESGRIPTGASRAMYWDFPAMFLTGSGIVQVTRLVTFDGINFFVSLFGPIIAGLLYLLFTKIIKNNAIAAFASILAVMGNMLLADGYTFHPFYPSLVLLLAFLLVLIEGTNVRLGTMRQTLIILVLLAATTITYFQTSIVFVGILLGCYLVQRLSKKSTIGFSAIILFLIVPLAWEMYCTFHTFDMLTSFLSQIMQNLEGGTFLQWFLFLGKTNIGVTIPLWATTVRLVWWLFIYGAGTIAGLMLLLKPKNLNTSGVLVTGGLLAAIVLTAVATILAPGGQRFTVYLLFAFLFTIPPLIYFFIKPGRIRKFGFMFIVILSFALSFPSFLANNGNIETESVYSYEVSSSQFLNYLYGSGAGLTIYEQIGVGTEQYYLPDAVAFGGQVWSPISKEELLQIHSDQLSGFLYPSKDERVFLTNNRMEISAEYSWGINPNDPFWQQMEQRLEDSNANRIYNNGYVQIWEPP